MIAIATYLFVIANLSPIYEVPYVPDYFGRMAPDLPLPVKEEPLFRNFVESSDLTITFDHALTFEVGPTCMTFPGGVQLHSDGKVVIPKGMKMEKAAKEFWRAVGQISPEMRRAIVAEWVNEQLRK